MSTVSLDTAPETVPGSGLLVGYEKRMMLTAGRASRELGGKISERLGVELTDAGLKTFADGEVYCRYAATRFAARISSSSSPPAAPSTRGSRSTTRSGSCCSWCTPPSTPRPTGSSP